MKERRQLHQLYREYLQRTRELAEACASGDGDRTEDLLQEREMLQREVDRLWAEVPESKLLGDDPGERADMAALLREVARLEAAIASLLNERCGRLAGRAAEAARRRIRAAAYRPEERGGPRAYDRRG